MVVVAISTNTVLSGGCVGASSGDLNPRNVRDNLDFDIWFCDSCRPGEEMNRHTKAERHKDQTGRLCLWAEHDQNVLLLTVYGDLFENIFRKRTVHTRNGGTNKNQPLRHSRDSSQ